MTARRESSEVNSEREVVGATPVRHVRSFAPDRTLCGAGRDPSQPTVWDQPECVVCIDMLAADPDLHQALRAYWRRNV